MQAAEANHRQTQEELRAALPAVIDNHELLRVIGSGAYGQVLLARNCLTGVYRAVKIVWRYAFSDPKPYEREFEAIKKFEPISREADGFVQILHVGSLPDAFYYIMELADDATGAPAIDPATYKPMLLTRTGDAPLTIAKCIEIGAQLAEALAKLHDRHLLHRDIKPSNIIFVRGRAKLADIGLVAKIGEARSFVGTAGFVPPEGPVRPESDIYSLGKVLYEIATGRDRCEFPELPSGLGQDAALYLELNQIILKACDPRPEQRYRTASAMGKELELLMHGASIKQLRRLEKRLRTVRLTFALFALIGGIVFAFTYIHERERAATQRRAGYLVTRGTDRMTDGDLGGALPFFLAAVRDDTGNEKNYQLRIGSLLAHGFRRVNVWQGWTDATFSRDGKLTLMSRGNDLEVRESTTGALLDKHSAKGLGALNWACALSPDNRHIGIGRTNFYLIDRATGQRTVFQVASEIYGLAFHPEGEGVLLGTPSGAIVLNHHSGEQASVPLPFEVDAAVFDAAGDRVVLLTLKGPAQAFSFPEMRPISRVFKHDMAYTGAFSPFHTNLVLTTGFDQAVYWDMLTGEIAGKSLGHEYGTFALALSPSQQYFASGGLDRVVRLCDSRSLLPLPRNSVLYHPDRVAALAFIDNETLVVHCSDGSNHIWELKASGEEISKLPWAPLPDRLSAEGAGLSIRAIGTQAEIADGGEATTLEVGREIAAVAVHPRGESLAIATSDSVTFAHHTAIVYRRGQLDAPAFVVRHLDGVLHAAYSPSGKKLATSSQDHTAIVWDAETGAQLTAPMRHRYQVHWAAFSADETWLATASWDKTAVVWDARTGEPLTVPIKFPFYLEWIEFGDDGLTLFAGNGHSGRAMAKLPMAPLPLEQWRDALPAPVSLVLNRSRF